jgi:hypothetical protein
MESVLDRVGELIGSAIRFVIDLIRWVFFGIDDAIDSFLNGIGRGIGLSNNSVPQLVVVAVGLILFWFAVRAFIDRRIVAGIVWTLIGLLVVSWVVR